MKVDKLTFEKDGDTFEAVFSIGGNEQSITLFDFQENQEVQVTALVNKILKWLDTALNESKLFAAKQLIELKNNTWLEENEEPINQIKFADNIKFSGITAFAGGSFQIYFEDNDIFWGHFIRVDVNADFKFESADIVG